MSKPSSKLRHTTSDALLRSAVRSCLQQIKREMPAVQGGSTDPEHLHRLRVGIRRLRTAIREMNDLVPRADLARWEPELAGSFRALGLIRDRDMIAARLGPQIREATGIDHVPWDAPAVEVHAAEALLHNGFLPALEAMQRFATSPRPGRPALDEHQRDRLLRCRLRRLHRAIVRGGRGFCDLPPETQHRVRKRLKRMRHLIEFIGPLFRHRDTQAYLHRIQPALDALSLHQDTLTALSMLHQARHAGDLRADAAARWLHARLRRTARRSQHALRRIEQAPRFWKRPRS